MRELMPFVKGKKFGEETGSDLTPKEGLPKDIVFDSDLADELISESTGSSPENKIKKILDEVTEYTPKQFLQRYTQKDYNLMTGMLEDAGFGVTSKNKTGDVTNFTLNEQFKSQGIGGSRANLGQGIGGPKIKTINQFDLPNELQNVGGMNWEKYAEPTEKYISGVTDKTKTVDGKIITTDSGIFAEGNQKLNAAALQSDIKLLEDTIGGFSDDDYNRPLSAADTKTTEAERLVRQNKARMRAGLDPKVKPTKLINPALDEFAGMSIGDYYTNQLISKKAELEELKINMGPGSEELTIMNRLDTASGNLSFGEMESTARPVDKPKVTTENPIKGVKEAGDIIKNKLIGSESGYVGPDYARGGKFEGKNIFSYQSKGKASIGGAVSRDPGAIKGIAEIEKYFSSRLAKGEPSVALLTAVKDYENIKAGHRQAGIAAGIPDAELNDYVSGKTWDDVVANVDKRDWMGTGLDKNAQFTKTPYISDIIEEAERTGQVSQIKSTFSGSSVTPSPDIEVKRIVDQINMNRLGESGASPTEVAKQLYPEKIPEDIVEIKGGPDTKMAGEVIGTRKINDAFTVDKVFLEKDPNTGNFSVKSSVTSNPITNSGLGPEVRDLNYGKTKDIHKSVSREVELDFTGVEPEGYDPLTKNKVVLLSGESATQGAKRAAVLAKVSGWDFESGSWKAHSDVNSYVGRQRTLRTLVDQGAINPNDIAWNAIATDLDAGTFDSSNIKKYLKTSGATDTAASALKTSVNIKSSSKKGTSVTIGSSKVPVVKTAKEVKPETPAPKTADPASVGTKKFTVDSLTDSEIMRLPAYKDLRDKLGASDELKNLRPEALDQITLTRTRSILKELAKQESAATKGFSKMIETIIKSR
tara:strand:+ start:5257 stop:7869 length:2613 start_codon:yes stop_codon:yes gene_type:complete